MKYWEIIADRLSKVGWNCGCISSTDDEGGQFWVVAAERSDAGRFIVRADEKLPAFVELESAIHARGEFNMHRKSRSGGMSGEPLHKN